ncbi:MAG: methyltransferase domain-containing protein [Phycisphaerales bacterium]|nr:MAG: methyltransferase domain-containing protein [Phycisphaerales bacterium]
MLVFARQLLKDRHHTGAILPSSGRLAREMTRALQVHRGQKRVLEVGPGTGPFTKSILRSLRDGDEFHVVELSPMFCRQIERRLIEPFRQQQPGVKIVLHNDPIQSAILPGSFDFIVCGLPFNNFPPDLVRAIFRRLIGLLAEDGRLTYFEYAGVRMLKSTVSSEAVRRKLKQIGMTGRVLKRRHDGTRKLVLGNVPPAIAVSLTRRDVAASERNG